MGISIDEIFSSASETTTINVFLATNSDNGIVSYARGVASFRPRRFSFDINRPYVLPARISTSGSQGLEYFFSDRVEFEAEPSGGPFAVSQQQPFSNDMTDRLGFSLSEPQWGPPVVKFTLHSWNNATFSVPMTKHGKILFGMGPPVGGGAEQAGYLVSFTRGPDIR
jgi:hypothetical protein